MPAESALSLVDRLRAALDRAEEIADAAIRPPSPPWASARLWRQRPENAAFMAANGPDLVLRTVAAHRKILELHGRAHECSQFDHHGEVDGFTYADDSDTCSTLLALAAVYFPEAPDA